MNILNRWEISYDEDQSIELTSGSVCEVKVGGHWIYTGIESSNGEYYATARGVQLVNGLPARPVTGSR